MVINKKIFSKSVFSIFLGVCGISGALENSQFKPEQPKPVSMDTIRAYDIKRRIEERFEFGTEPKEKIIHLYK